MSRAGLQGHCNGEGSELLAWEEQPYSHLPTLPGKTDQGESRKQEMLCGIETPWMGAQGVWQPLCFFSELSDCPQDQSPGVSRGSCQQVVESKGTGLKESTGNFPLPLRA